MSLNRRSLSYLLALMLITAGGLAKNWSRVDERGTPVAFESRPMPECLNKWKCVHIGSFSKYVTRMLRQDGGHRQIYKMGENYADVLVLYGHRKRTFHLPDSCLAGAGITIKSRQMVLLRGDRGEKIPFHALLLEDGDRSCLALYTFVDPNGKATDLLGLNFTMIWNRARGICPKGAALRVMGTYDPARSISAQPVANLAVDALREVGERVRHAQNDAMQSTQIEHERGKI